MVSIRAKRGLVGLVVAVVFTGMVLAAAGPADSGKGKDKAPGLKKAGKKGPANKDKGDSKMPKGLEEARDRVRAKFQERLKAALKAMSQGHRKGVPIEATEGMANAGLEQGLDAKDFEPLGRFVAEQHANGLKGEKLAEAIHAEVKQRQEARREALQAKKEGKGKDKAKGKGKGKGKGKDKDEDEGKGKGKGKGKDKDEDPGKGKGKGKGKGGRGDD